jgi:phenylalanyl-tRNA synthetase beta chain
MPTVEVELWDLRNLGVKLPKDQLIDKLAMFGTPVDEVSGDILKIEINPNRPDMLSAEGIARAIRIFTGKPSKLYLAYKPTIEVKAEEVQCRPHSSFAVIREAKMTDDLIKSIMQLQEKLHVTHGRKRRKVAIGIHDISKVKPPIRYVAMKPEDVTFIPLQCKKEMTGKEILENIPKGGEYGYIIENEKKWPVLMDSRQRIMALPPIINSELTRLRPETTDLFIDVTGTDADAVDKALTILTTAWAERGAKIEQVLVKGSFNKITPDLVPRTMKFDFDYAKKILGIDIDLIDAASLLTRMGHFVEVKNPMEVKIAPYRTDLLHPFDLVEEIAIAYGYNNFDPTIPKVATVAKSRKMEDFANQVRMILVGLGFQDCFTFVMSNHQRLFSKMNQPPRQIAEVLNPKTSEYSLLRDQLVPSLMEVLQNNKPSGYPQRFSEAGEVVYLDKSEETGTKNRYKLAGVVAHTRANFTEIKSVVEAVLRNLNIKAKFNSGENASFVPGRFAKFEYGYFGEIHPQVLNNWELEVPVAAFEIDLEAIFKKKK